MQIANRMNAGSAGDNLNNLAGKNEAPATSASRDAANAAAVSLAGYDPASRISLSVEAMLFLGRKKSAPEKYPPLTREEWDNRLSPELAAREHQAFGRFGETGDYKAYYRAFIEYYDNLRVEDQNSLRYFGTREAALAGARSVEYDSESGLDGESSFHALVSVMLDTDKPQSEFTVREAKDLPSSGDMFGWDVGSITYEDVSQVGATVSEIERFYKETF